MGGFDEGAIDCLSGFLPVEQTQRGHWITPGGVWPMRVWDDWKSSLFLYGLDEKTWLHVVDV